MKFISKKKLKITLKAANHCYTSYKNDYTDTDCVVVFKRNNLIAFVHEESETVYMVFRGTDELRDVHTLLFTRVENNPQCVAFCRRVAAFCVALKKLRIVSTGHSFGGVLAQLALHSLNDDTECAKQLITFGCPLFVTNNNNNNNNNNNKKGTRGGDTTNTHVDVWIHVRDLIGKRGLKFLSNLNSYQLYFLSDEKTLLKNSHSIKSYMKFLKKLNEFHSKITYSE